MSPTVNTDGRIGSDIFVKAERPETLTVARGSSPLDWGQESRPSQSSSLLFIAMESKVVIGGAPDGDLYGVHAMDGSG